MMHRWLAPRRRGVKKARALSACLRVEQLEKRNLLSGLVFVPSPQVTGGQLGSAAAIAANDIWAVGATVNLNQQNQFVYQTLAEHFNGTSWSVVPTSAPVSNPVFSGVAAAASNDVWVVGGSTDTSNSFIEHWNGAGWSVVSSQANTNLVAVTAPASNSAWAVGSVSGSNNALVEHWDGTSWNIVTSPAFAGVSVGAVSADSPNDVWAVGSASPAFVGGSPSPVALHWNGQNWNVIAAANFSLGFTFAAVTALSPTNVWADGNSAIPGGEYHKFVGTVEHWDGTSWSVVPLNATTKQSSGTALHGIAAVSANDVYAVGDIGNFDTLVEHWNGTNLSIVNSPNPNYGNNLYGATALSDGTVAAVGVQENSSSVSTPLILQNSASAPKNWKTPAAQATTETTSGTTAGAQTTARPATLEAVLVDHLFVATGKANHPLKFGALSSKTLHVAAIGNLDFLREGMWLLDRN